MNRFDAVLFDLDGTLLYTLADIAAAVNGALREMRRPERTVTEIRSMVGNGAKMLITRALGPGREALIDDTLAVYARLYAAHAQEHVTPYAGIPELLDALHERGIRTACVTNKDHTAAALGEGEVSEIVESYYGYHIILRKPLDEAKAVDAVRETYFSGLLESRIEDAAVEMNPAVEALDLVDIYDAFSLLMDTDADGDTADDTATENGQETAES